MCMCDKWRSHEQVNHCHCITATSDIQLTNSFFISLAFEFVYTISQVTCEAMRLGSTFDIISSALTIASTISRELNDKRNAGFSES